MVIELPLWAGSSATFIGLGAWVLLLAFVGPAQQGKRGESLAIIGWIFVGGLAGAFLWGQILGSGGVSSLGALVGAGAVFALRFFGAQQSEQSRWEEFDRFVVAGLLGGGVARLGCLFEGCDVGRLTDGGLGVVYGVNTRAWEVQALWYDLPLYEQASAPVHPLGLYLGGLGILLGISAWNARKIIQAPGIIGLIFGSLFFLVAALLEMLREPAFTTRITEGISVHTFLLGLLGIASLGVLLYRYRSLETKEEC